MEEILLNILKDILENNALDKDVSLDNCDQWDSMAHLNLIIAIEGRFDLSIEPEDIEGLTSFIKIRDYIVAIRK